MNCWSSIIPPDPPPNICMLLLLDCVERDTMAVRGTKEVDWILEGGAIPKASTPLLLDPEDAKRIARAADLKYMIVCICIDYYKACVCVCVGVR
mmetsp:Transcript_17066/g.23443  ORF Transcript_17066/g.23443 Transcript_17066/m.23443 type:complete len:94 (+) Transcript_17066:1278-1559(+)